MVDGPWLCADQRRGARKHKARSERERLAEANRLKFGRTKADKTQSRLEANDTLYPGVTLGRRCLIHSGTVLGADGFGMARAPEGWIKVPQVGGVRIGDDVEIGANTTVDRGAIEDTVIGNGVKLDNQIQIGHNCVIGEHTAIAGCTAVAGSTSIGKRCMIAGGVGIAGHLIIVDDVVVTAVTFVTHSIAAPGVYSGSLGFDTQRRWQRRVAHFRRLDGSKGDDKDKDGGDDRE